MYWISVRCHRQPRWAADWNEEAPSKAAALLSLRRWLEQSGQLDRWRGQLTIIVWPEADQAKARERPVPKPPPRREGG